MNDATKKDPQKARRYRVNIDEGVCDGCAICVFYCNPTVLEISSELNRRGISPAVVINGPACTNCGLCVIACPQIAIAVVEISGGPRPDSGPKGER